MTPRKNLTLRLPTALYEKIASQGGTINATIVACLEQSFGKSSQSLEKCIEARLSDLEIEARLSDLEMSQARLEYALIERTESYDRPSELNAEPPMEREDPLELIESFLASPPEPDLEVMKAAIAQAPKSNITLSEPRKTYEFDSEGTRELLESAGIDWEKL